MHQPFVTQSLSEAFSPPPKVLVSLRTTMSYLGPVFRMMLRNYSITSGRMLLGSLVLINPHCQVGSVQIWTENLIHEVKLVSRMNLNLKSSLISSKPFAFHYILIET